MTQARQPCENDFSVDGNAHATTGWSNCAASTVSTPLHCVAGDEVLPRSKRRRRLGGTGCGPRGEAQSAPQTGKRRWRGTGSWRRLAWLLGVVLVVGAVGVLTGQWLHAEWSGVGARTLPGATCEAERAVHRTGPPEAKESTPSDEEGVSDELPSQEANASTPTPERTLARRSGTIEVVDVGTSEESLASALRKQHELARHRGQTLLVMLTGRRCRPCRGVDESLSDPQMQVALDGVRLVRVDLDVFREEIDLLGTPRDIYPAFFLVGADHRPRDTIHGGEWGQDIAKNIAPVLGAFVRGRYEQRRYQRAPTSRSLRL